ncbi:MAG: hypothetical protein IJ220_00280 [Clostridia bacterium]|nr:hypothetical protein [Clostridia bacterium]
MLLLVVVIGIDFIKLIKVSEIDCVIADLSAYDLKEFNILKTTIENITLLIICDSNLIVQEGNCMERAYKKFSKPINYEEILYCIEEISFKTKEVSNKNQQISNILLNLGFDISNIGTRYLIEAITCSIDNSKLKNLKAIYLYIANKYSIDYLSIKWAIQNSLNKFNNTIDEKIIQEFFGITDNRRLTPKYIINFFKVYYQF